MPAFNYDRAAMVLAEAAFHGDGPTAQRHGVPLRTLQSWRQRAQTDATLAAFCAQKKREISEGWTLDVNRALASGAAFIQRCVESFEPSPEHLYAVVGAIKILSEATLTKDALNARNPEPYRAPDAASGSVVPINAERRRAG